MNLKKFLFSISAMSLAASLASVATPARAEQDNDRDHDGNRHGRKSPQVVLISLDGAKPDFIQKFIDEGVLPRDGGLARLSRHGTVALQNVTASPSLTAVSHIAIATGSTAVHNDIPSNTFEAVVAPISSSLSGFAAPIGGYQESPLGPSPQPTALPLWVQLRQQGFAVKSGERCKFPIRIPGVMTSSGISQKPAHGTLRQINVTTFTYAAPRGYKDSDTFAIYGSGKGPYGSGRSVITVNATIQ